MVLRRSAVRVRWERVGRVSLLLVLAVVIGLYAQHALSFVSTHAQAERELSNVHQLIHDNAALAREQRSLGETSTIERDARALGMVQPNERSYVITGLK
jgi:cell division protein FtsL